MPRPDTLPRGLPRRVLLGGGAALAALESGWRMDRIAGEMARRGCPDRVIERVLGASFASALGEARGA